MARDPREFFERYEAYEHTLEELFAHPEQPPALFWEDDSIASFTREQLAAAFDARPVDATERAVIERAMRAIYAEVDWPWHHNVLWAPSPRAGVLAHGLLTQMLATPAAKKVLRPSAWATTLRLRRALRDRVRVVLRTLALACWLLLGCCVLMLFFLWVPWLKGSSLPTIICGIGMVGMLVFNAAAWRLKRLREPTLLALQSALYGHLSRLYGTNFAAQVHGAVGRPLHAAMRSTERVIETSVAVDVNAVTATEARTAQHLACQGFERRSGTAAQPLWIGSLSPAAFAPPSLGGALGIESNPEHRWLRRRLPECFTARQRRLLDAYERLSSAGPVWLNPDFAIVCERPTTVRLREPLGDDFAVPALHDPSGPALAWADSYRLYFHHGVHIPTEAIETDGDARVLATQFEREPAALLQAIERLGWPEFFRGTDAVPVASAFDPGNGDNKLELFDPPAPLRNAHFRVLVMTNGSPDRAGHYAQLGELVPREIGDPIAAAAWQYGCDAEQYRALIRRT